MATQVRCARRRVLPVRLEETIILRRAVCPCEMLPKGIPGLASINGQTYTLAYNATLPEEGEPTVHGYRLTSTETGKSYDIDAETMVCDCPDAEYRQRACKHVHAITKLRADGKLA